MEPISAIVGVGIIGYLFNEHKKEKQFINRNDSNIPVSNLNSCAENYPWNYVENFKEVKNKSKTTNPLKSGEPEIYSKDTNFLEFTGETKNTDYLLNAKERPVQDFLVNNTVPGNTRQNMVGTGVKQGNVDFSKYNVGNGRLTSHYRALSSFTGCDEMYIHKREVPNMFSPAERTDRVTIPGMRPEAQRPLTDRYTTSILTKNDERPTEAIRVGPGINTDANLPTDGQGFNSGLTVRPMPNNVGEYKLTQLAGRVTGTKSQTPNLPSAMPGNITIGKDSNGNDITYGVPSNNKNPYVTLEQRPLINQHPGNIYAQSERPEFVPRSGLGKKNTNVQFGQSVPCN